MENQLQKSSVKNLLQEECIQHATGRVRSASLQEEMSLVGFVPYSLSNLYLQLAMYMDLNDGKNQYRLSNFQVHSIGFTKQI